MSDDIEIQKTIRRLTRRYNAPGHELVNDDGPAAVAIIEALVKQRDEAIGAFNNLAIESKALTYFNRAEKAEAEVERLKEALEVSQKELKATQLVSLHLINNLEEIASYDTAIECDEDGEEEQVEADVLIKRARSALEAKP